MTALRRHVIAVVAALFALAVGIALGGGPLSYVPADDEVATDTSGAAGPGDEVDPVPPVGSDAAAFGDAFAAATAPMLYAQGLRGHPTAILAMPGVEPALVDAMADQVDAAGGGLTGVFALTDDATVPGETSLVDTLGSQLMTQLDDTRIDPATSTYVRFGQLVGLAMSSPVKDGVHADDSAETIRSSLATAQLLTAPEGARLAPLVLLLLPPGAAADDEDPLATASVFTGIAAGVRANAAGVVVLGDSASGDDGVLAELRDDPDLAASVATVDGADSTPGRVAAVLALIGALDGSVGAYGASGSDGAAPIS